MKQSLPESRRFFRSLVRWLDDTVAKRLHRGQRHAPLPLLEELEPRMVPAMVTWLLPVSGDWDTGANWSTGVVPTAADDVSIPFANITVTHSTTANDAVHSLVDASSFSLSAGSLSIGTTGHFNTSYLQTGGTLSGAGSITLSGPTTWSGGTMNGTGLTVLQGMTTLSGNDTLDTRTLNNFGTASDSGTLTQTNSAVLNNESSATWNMQDSSRIGGSGTFNDLGTLTTTGSSSFAGSSFSLGGTLNGAGTITFTPAATFTWSGTMSGTGVTNIQGPLSLAFTTPNPTLDTRTLNYFGTTVSNFSTLNFANGAVLNNESGATFAFNFSSSQPVFTGSGTFNNLGTFQFDSNNANDIQVVFNNSGILNVVGTGNNNSGSLSLNGGGTDSGSDSIAAGATLAFGSGPAYNFTSHSDVTGGGGITVNSSGNVTVAGGFTPTGPIDIIAGDATFTNTVNGTGSATFTSLTFDLGSLEGNATITVTGATSWDAGSMGGSGVTNLLGSSTFFTSGSVTDGLDMRTLNNFGTLTTENVSIPLTNGAVINNESGATWNLQTTDLETGTVNNFGKLNVSGGLNQLNGQFTRATINNADTVTLASNSTFTFGTFTQTGGLLQGSGVLNGNVIVNGGIVNPGVSTATPGVMTVTGNYTQGANTSLDELIEGTMSGTQYSVLAVSDTATLNGPLNIQLGNGFVPTVGETFQIVTAGSVSGTFTTVNGLAINGSESFTLTYGATAVTLTVTSIPVSPPPVSPPPVSPPPVSPPPVVVPDKIGEAYALSNGVLGWTLSPSLTSLSGSVSFTYGAATDFPLVGDWAGNGTDAVGVVRQTPAGGLQWVLDSNDSDAYEASDSNYYYGAATDAPVVGDWTGNGATKIGVVRALPNGVAQWTLNTSGAGMYIPGVDKITTYGLATDHFVVGDWTGSGKDELGVVRPGLGGGAEWVLDTSGTGSYVPSDAVYHFGVATDTFIVGDWNGDGKTEIGVARPGPNGTVVFTLDTNGDGVYDAGDQVFALTPSQAAAMFEFGNWHVFSGSSPSTPSTANPFAGTYTGLFTGTSTMGSGTLPVNGSLNYSVASNGNITVTNPGSGTGTVNASTGAAQITGVGQIGGVQSNYAFDGTFVLGGSDSATVSGTWTALFTGGSASGTWTGSRQ